MTKRIWQYLLLLKLCFFLSTLSGLGQEKLTLNDFKGASNNVSSGSLNINIPLYTLEEDGAQVPIYLSYDGTGVKISDQSSCVGLKWTLHAGGNIKHTIMQGGGSGGGDNYIYDTSGRRINGTYVPGDNTHKPHCKMKPDIFRYSLPGLSGLFFDDYKNQNKVLVNGKKCAITKNDIDFYGEDDAYNIRDNNGVNYTFQNGKYVLTTGPHAQYISDIYIDVFPLRKIETHNGDEITFDYSYSSHGKLFLKQKSIAGGIHTEILESEYGVYNVTEIISSNKIISFTYQADDRHADLLKYIIVKNKHDKTVEKKYAFDYSGTDFNHIFLEKIYLIGEKGTFNELYSFDYNSTELPKTSDRESWKLAACKQDFFGYYNANTKKHIIPFAYDGIPNNKANRFFDSERIKAGVLEEITLPDGGKFHYSYKPKWDGEFYGGGLVIDEVSKFSGNKLLNRTKYKYDKLIGFVAPNTVSGLEKYRNQFVFKYDKVKWEVDPIEFHETEMIKSNFDQFPEQHHPDIREYASQSLANKGATNGNFFYSITKEEIGEGKYNGSEVTKYTYAKAGFSYYGIPEWNILNNSSGIPIRKTNYMYSWKKSDQKHPYITARTTVYTRSATYHNTRSYRDQYFQSYLGLGYPLPSKTTQTTYKGENLSTTTEYTYTDKDQIRSIHKKTEGESSSYQNFKYSYDYTDNKDYWAIDNNSGKNKLTPLTTDDGRVMEDLEPDEENSGPLYYTNSWLHMMTNSHQYLPVVIAKGVDVNSFYNAQILKYDYKGKVNRIYSKGEYNSFSVLPDIVDYNLSTDGYELEQSLAYDVEGNPTESVNKFDIANSKIWDGEKTIAVSSNSRRGNIAYNSFEQKASINWMNFTRSAGGFTGNYSSSLGSSSSTFTCNSPTNDLKRIKIEFWAKTNGTSTNSNGRISIDIVVNNSQRLPLVNKNYTTTGVWKKYQFDIRLDQLSPFYASKITYNFSGSGILIDEIRISPYEANMETYGYDIKERLSYRCDALCNPIHYIYDEFDRIIEIKDRDGNILQKNAFDKNGINAEITKESFEYHW